ncbi:cyclophilin-like fold protein [Exiguobacterium oxidotolerans]|uniref:Cyclophilin-like protein n=1 Tax=Exiguobacterium oxidotolerans TaxID=223958 RepID=A0A653IEG9_9BACL
MQIEIDDHVVVLELEPNKTTELLRKTAPFTIKMDDLHGNEKFHYFEQSFPVDPKLVRLIEAGDVMMYQNNCLVIFYETLKPTTRYTRIGKIKDVEQLLPRLGHGSVEVRFF